MKIKVMLMAAAICCASSLQAQAVPAPAPGSPADPAKVYDAMVTRYEKNLMALAEAMPADKYNFAPSADYFKSGANVNFTGVRSFGQELTHLASEPYHFFGGFGVQPDAPVDVKALSTLTNKEDILKALHDSFAFEHKVIATITLQNAFLPTGARGATLAGAVAGGLNDGGDHYGQLVEYLRMNGIVPPASVRPAKPMIRPVSDAIPAPVSR